MPNTSTFSSGATAGLIDEPNRCQWKDCPHGEDCVHAAPPAPAAAIQPGEPVDDDRLRDLIVKLGLWGKRKEVRALIATLAEPSDTARLDWVIHDLLKSGDLVTAALHDDDGFPIEAAKARPAIDRAMHAIAKAQPGTGSGKS